MADEPQTDGTNPEAATGVVETDGAEPKKLNQQVEIKDVGPCKKHIKVSIERADLDSRLSDKFNEIAPDASMAGFRPGKAPRKLVEKHYHKEVGDQVKAEVLLQSLEQLADDYDIAPLSAPNIDPFKIELPKQGPMLYEFEVEVRPHFDLPNYKGLKLKRPVKTFNDEDVAKEERRLLAPYGQVIPKAKGTVEIGWHVPSHRRPWQARHALRGLAERATRKRWALDQLLEGAADCSSAAAVGSFISPGTACSSTSAIAPSRSRTPRAIAGTQAEFPRNPARRTSHPIRSHQGRC